MFRRKVPFPSFLSHTPRNKWKDGKIERNTESFGKWTREAAEATGAYFIDLNKISADKLEKKGVEESCSLLQSRPYTYFFERSAHERQKYC